MKKFLKLISLGIVLLLVLAVAALWFLTTSPGEKFIKGWLEDSLTSEIGLAVSIGRLETNLWSHVQIDTLIVGAIPGHDKQPAIYVGKIYVGYSIPQLLGNTVSLKTLFVDSVALGIALDSLGRFGIPVMDTPAAAPSDSLAKTTMVCIDTISVKRLGLSYFDPQLPLSVELAGAVLAARGTRDGTCSGHLAVGSIAAAYDSLAFTIDNLEIAATLDSEAVSLEYARADCAGLHLEATGDLGLAESAKMALTLSLEGSLDTLASLMTVTYDAPSFEAGHVSAECQIEGVVDDPHVSMHADFADLAFGGVAVPSARFMAQYYHDSVQVDTFMVTTLNGIISGDVMAVLDTLGAASVNMVMNGIDLSSVWRAIYSETSPYQGSLNGRISAHGEGYDFAAWSVDATVAGKGMRYLKRSVPDLECKVMSQSGRASFALVHGADEIHAEIQFTEDTLRGTCEVSVPELKVLARFFDQPELSGRLSARGAFGGTYANPSSRFTINGSGISYQNVPVDSLFAELSYQDSILSIVNFFCEGRLDSVDSQQPPFGLDSIAGSLVYACRVRGPLDNLSGDLRAHLNNPGYSSYALDSLSLMATLDGSKLVIDELEASFDSLGVRLQATYDTSTASGSFDILLHTLTADPFRDDATVPDTVEVRPDFGSISGGFTLGNHSDVSATVHGEGLWPGLQPMFTGDTILTGGDVAFDLTLDGPYLAPSAVLNARAVAVQVSDYRIDSVSMHLEMSPEALVLDSLVSYAYGNTLRLSGWLEAGLSADSVFEIRDSASVTAEMITTDFDLSVLEELAQIDGKIAGLASAALKVSGTVAVPRFGGWLSVRDGLVVLDEESLPLENIGLILAFADSTISVDSAVASIADLTVEASGTLTTSSYESVAIALTAGVGGLGTLSIDGMVSDTSVNLQVLADSIDLAVLQPFMIELDSLTGNMDCSMLVLGTPEVPQLDGSLRISTMSLQWPRHYVVLSDGHANVRFDKKRVILDSAVMILNGGELAISGIAVHELGELEDLNLTIRANHLKFQEPHYYTLAVDSAVLNYGKQQQNYVLDGEIVLGETRLTAGLRPTSILPWVQSMETVEIELPELLARSRLDVRIRESDKLWVDNNLARIRMRAEMGVIGTPLRPNFTGLLKIEEGYLLYIDRRFRVNEGTVYFNDPARFNPDINLDASTQVTVYKRTAGESYTVFIRAEGLLDQLQYGLYSDPPLDKPDIVALLTLGATRTELAGGNNGNGGSGLTGVLKDRAAALTSDKVSGYLSRRAGSLFGFDEFTIQGNLFQFDETWGPQLVASKRLSKRVDFTYATTVGHLNDQTVRLGYRLTPRWSLQGETDRQGRAGLDLKYGLTFK